MSEDSSALPWSINRDDYELQEVIGEPGACEGRPRAAGRGGGGVGVRGLGTGLRGDRRPWERGRARASFQCLRGGAPPAGVWRSCGSAPRTAGRLLVRGTGEAGHRGREGRFWLVPGRE